MFPPLALSHHQVVWAVFAGAELLRDQVGTVFTVGRITASGVVYVSLRLAVDLCQLNAAHWQLCASSNTDNPIGAKVLWPKPYMAIALKKVLAMAIVASPVAVDPPLVRTPT